MSALLPVAVFGAGHMGRHHVRLYSQMPGVRLAAVIDANPDRARALAEPLGVRFAERWTPELCDLVAASVAVPTVRHLEVAQPLIERGVAVLIEKPLAPDTRQAEAIAELARRHDAIVQVGHTERFNPAVQAVKRLGVRPRFIETQRISPFTFRSADVGVVFDMMIHDIDILTHLVGEEVERIDAVGVAVLGPHEDVANVRIECRGGAVANLTASRLALKTERKLRVFCEDAYLSLDYQRKIGIAITKDRNLDILKIARERNLEDLSQLAGLDFGKMVQVEPLSVAAGDALQTELDVFIETVRQRRTGDFASADFTTAESVGTPGRATPASVDDGVSAVRIAERIVAAIQTHRWER